jgi:LuxR family maltose regulon positive regulatory protein
MKVEDMDSYEKRNHGSVNHCNLDQGLIRTKCHPPRITAQRVLRRDLSQKLAGALNCKLTTVTAPAGYGKSTAVIDWLGQTGLPVAWVSLDANDNRPEVFWRYICLALGGVLGGVSDATSYIFLSPELLKTNTHLHILIDRLSASKKELLLTLDDFHFITTPEVLKNFSYFVNYLPAHVHVILISRTEPGLELAKLRLGGALLRVDRNDLQFQTEEIAQFYQVKGLAFEREELERIEEYTQGWVAALVAVAMDPEAKLPRERRNLHGRFHHGGQLIDQFLEEELVGKWSEEKRDFLLATSILESLCGPLCDAVTGFDGGSERLRQLWLQNELLIALDNEDCWYRYHPLFGNFLRKVLAGQVSLSVPELHLKAARWYEDNELIYPAIEHYLEGSYFEAAIKLINSEGRFLFAQGDYSKLFLLMNRLPEPLTRNNIETIFLQARYYTDNNLFEAAEKCLDRLRELMKGTIEDPYYLAVYPFIQKGLKLMEAYLLLCRGKLAEFQAKFKAAKAIKTEASNLDDNYMDFNLSEIYLYRCQPGLGLIKLFKSGPQAFQHIKADYQEMIAEDPGFAQLTAGEFYYEANRPDEALPYLATAVNEGAGGKCPGSLVPAMVTIARIRRAQNEIAAAYDAVWECEKRLMRTNRPHWNYLLNAFKTRLDLDAGRTAAVEEWLATSKLHIYQEITKTGEYELLVFARCLMSQGRFRDAAILLQRLLAFAEAEKRLHSTVEILNLLAITTAKTGDNARALELLEKSLVIGLQEGYVCSFVDEFAPMAALLEKYLLSVKEPKEPADSRRGQLMTYAAELLTAIQSSPFKTAFMSKKATGPRVTVKCFGSFAIYQDGHPLNCKNSKVREILAYLVHNQGEAVGWEKIVEAIWPDCPYEKAHHNFHMTMHLLRKFLKNHAITEILDYSRGNYRVRPERLDCDMYEFSRIFTEPEHTPAADPQWVETAKRLYTGGYFEENGFIWAYAKAANLETMYCELINKK